MPPIPGRSSLLEAVVAAGRFERSVRRTPDLRVQRGQRKWAGADAAHPGALLTRAARELRRLTASFDGGGDRRAAS
jgi:hypothetical protein